MAATDAGFWRHALNWARHHAVGGRNAAPLPPELTPSGPGRSIAGHALLRTIAQGAMGELHLALDPSRQQLVAIKTMSLSGGALARERFLRESTSAMRLHHPHIVHTHAAGIEGQGRTALGWLAMEWVPGHDLRRHASPPHLLPEVLVLRLAAQAADALHHAHGQGVVHRDLKPANVLVNLAQQEAKVSDFGCARLTDAERSRSGLLIGTPVYMAPEQVLGAPVDGRCDIYALGVMVWQMLTGRLPYEAKSMGDLLNQIVGHPTPCLRAWRPDLPPLISDIVARALSKQPEQRQANAAELARDFRLVAVRLGMGVAARDHASEAQ